ncbi:rRNA-processing protein efg1 [Cytospora paraplurivora]|uniref:rRNA-processing protein EFG1 n=1 Tax=Cytospora paraplurivora TaxID=2898453 RepID=A0AAN9U8H4_9PEZI
MGAKRPFSEEESQQNEAFKKRRQQAKTHYKPSNDSGPSDKQSLNDIKKRARNIERRFAKGGLPADVQQKLERELVQCKRQIGDLQHKKKRAEMISKYHQVRFFDYRWIERQKAERLRKKLKKQLDETTDPEEKAKLQADFHIADVDVHYTRYFPFLERYEGLYAAEQSKEDSDGQTIAERALHSARPPMWKVVEEALEKGQAALLALQERRTEAPNTEEKKKVAPREKLAKPSSGDKSRIDGPGSEKPPRRPATWEGSEAAQSMPGNRRERRRQARLQAEGKPVPAKEDDAAADSDGSGFFG